MSARPTRAALAAVAAAGVLYLLARVAGGGWLALAAATALAVPISSVLLRPSLTTLEVALRGPARVSARAQLVQVLVIRNTGRRRTPAAVWSERSAGRSPASVSIAPLEPGQEQRLVLHREAGQRGSYVGDRASLTTTAPFGAIRWTRFLPASPPLLVHPVLVPTGVRRYSGAGSGGQSSPVAGAGSEVLGLRPWRPGDSTRGLSARATARHGRPVLLERERESAASLSVVVGPRGFGQSWEDRISYVASEALRALGEGRPVRLWKGGAAQQPPIGSDSQAVLDFFARADDAGEVDSALLRRAEATVHPGGTVLIVAGESSRLTVPAAACCQFEVVRGG